VKFFYAKVVDILHVLVGPLRVSQRGIRKGGRVSYRREKEYKGKDRIRGY